MKLLLVFVAVLVICLATVYGASFEMTPGEEFMLTAEQGDEFNPRVVRAADPQRGYYGGRGGYRRGGGRDRYYRRRGRYYY